MAWERIERDNDPDRCESNDATGQCRYKALPGLKRCQRHASNKEQEQKKEQTLTNYRLMRWETRVREFTNSDGLKSLREEIGISRVILEEIWNQCENTTTLIMYSDKLHHCVSQIERLIISCQKLEERNSLLLDKSAVINLADQMVKILSDYIDDPLKLSEIGEMFMKAITMSATSAHEALIRDKA